MKCSKEDMKRKPFLDVTFSNFSKQFQRNISRPNNKNNGKFWNWNHVHFLRWKIWSLVIFQKLENLAILQSLDVMKSKVGQKGAKFVYYIPTVTKRSNSTTGFFKVSNSFLRPVFLDCDIIRHFYSLVLTWF